MTTLTLAAPLAPATGRSGITDAIRSEWTKIRTVRSTVWSLIAMAGITIGVMSLISWLRVARGWSTLPPDRQLDLLHNPLDLILATPFQIAQMAVAVLGVMVISSEYTTGMIRSTLQAQPRRETIFVAKIAVFSVLMFVVGELLSFAAFFIGSGIISGHVTVHLGDPGVLRVVFGAGVYVAVLGLFALGFGTILRHTAGAITAVLGLILVISPLTDLLPSSWGAHINAWMPTNAGSLIFNTHADPGTLLTPWQGMTVFAGWTVLVLVIAAVMFRKRDA
jgi:ABC-2 type transport system permease protein